MAFLLSPTRLFHSVQASALATHPYTYTPRVPGCPARLSPLCRPGSPAHTRTGGGGLPAPGPASRTAGHLRCTSCTRRPLPTGTGRRCRLGQCGSTGGWQRAHYVDTIRYLRKKHQDLWKPSETSVERGVLSLIWQTLTACKKSDPRSL